MHERPVITASFHSKEFDKIIFVGFENLRKSDDFGLQIRGKKFTKFRKIRKSGNEKTKGGFNHG